MREIYDKRHDEFSSSSVYGTTGSCLFREQDERQSWREREMRTRVIAEAASLTIVLSKGWDTIRSIFSILDRNTIIEPENKKGY
ncbi:hypothetical protein PanWU01x14_159180 [Parasponia andersonii]|uniref:Uncharacterized protein n=1 Tax=Parasponia andersonii TaxID=3476 RepID=A0A2P5CEE7_PARAD|nr:hypothetical protein PanWU01x14_159180 [Parasponia andersonii]